MPNIKAIVTGHRPFVISAPRGTIVADLVADNFRMVRAAASDSGVNIDSVTLGKVQSVDGVLDDLHVFEDQEDGAAPYMITFAKSVQGGL